MAHRPASHAAERSRYAVHEGLKSHPGLDLGLRHTSESFLDAAEYAFEFLDEHDPEREGHRERARDRARLAEDRARPSGATKRRLAERSPGPAGSSTASTSRRGEVTSEPHSKRDQVGINPLQVARQRDCVAREHAPAEEDAADARLKAGAPCDRERLPLPRRLVDRALAGDDEVVPARVEPDELEHELGAGERAPRRATRARRRGRPAAPELGTSPNG